MDVTNTATLTADETQTFAIPTRAIINADFIHGYNALNQHLVVYRHVRDSRKLYFGRITHVIPGKYALDIYVEPCKGQGVTMVKPFHVTEVRLVGGEA